MAEIKNKIQKFLKLILTILWFVSEIMVLLIFNTIFYLVADNYFGWNPRGIMWYDIAMFSIIESIFLRIWWYLVAIKKL